MFSSCIIFQIQSERLLREAYIDEDNELGKWLKQLFFRLTTFLPSSENVEDAFTDLISILSR